MIVLILATLPEPARGERRVVKRAQKGDVAAFERLIDHHDDAMRGLAFSMLGSRTAMDDVLQNAYLAAFRALPRFDGRAAFGTWLYRIVANACLDELRRTQRRGEVVDLALVTDTAAGPRDSTIDRLDLRAALDALPADLRLVVLMVDAEGFSYDEVAEVVGVPAGTVASRLHRARAALRPALTTEHAA